jgi:hypothetical protein
MADGWCWFVLREEYCWLVAGGCWFVLREKYRSAAKTSMARIEWHHLLPCDLMCGKQGKLPEIEPTNTTMLIQSRHST